MRSNIRQEILDAARELFNERGFNGVSTRDIADKLGISKGNLTYHFKKKEDIIEAIVFETQNPPAHTAPTTLEELYDFFIRFQSSVQNNALIFWHHAELSELSPKIREKQRLIYHDTVERLGHTFHTLREGGMLRDELYSGEDNSAIDALYLSMIYWMPFIELKQVESFESSFQHHVWGIIYPMLTQKGREAILDIVPTLLNGASF